MTFLTTSFVFAFVSMFGLTLELDAQFVTTPDATPVVEAAEAPPTETAEALAPAAASAAIDSRAVPGASAFPTRSGVADALARRVKIGRIHRVLGISTWGAMTAAVVLGTLQYANLY